VATRDDDDPAFVAKLPRDFPDEASELGRPLFQVDRSVGTRDLTGMGWMSLGLAAAGVGAIFLNLTQFYYYAFDRAEHFAPGAGPPWPNICCMPISIPWTLGFAWLGVKLLTKAFRGWRAYVVVYPAGFVLFDGGRFSIWRWADVTCVNMQNVDQREFVYFIQTSRLLMKYYRLRNDKGNEYEFWGNHQEGAAEFGQMIERETYPLMMSAINSQFQAGRSVEFGPFRVDLRGLTYKGVSTPWAEVGPITFKQGAVLIHRGNNSEAKVMLKKVDNYHVFLPLLAEHFGVRFEQ
jgi:hypothetical protein